MKRTLSGAYDENTKRANIEAQQEEQAPSGRGKVGKPLRYTPALAAEGDEEELGNKDKEILLDSDCMAMIKAIQAKPNWETKLLNQSIAVKWFSEAKAQGASTSNIEKVFAHLLGEIVSEKTQSYLDVPDEQDPEYLAGAVRYNTDFDYAPGEEEEITSGHYEGVLHVDNIVPEELRNSLEEKLDKIASKPEKDFHPGSNNMIQDLVHPSLFPYIKGISFENSLTISTNTNTTKKVNLYEKYKAKAAKYTEKVKKEGRNWEVEQLEELTKTEKDKEIPNEFLPSIFVADSGNSNSGDDEGKENDKQENENEDEKEENEEENEAKAKEEEEIAAYEDEGLDADSERAIRKRIAEFKGFDSVYQWIPAEYKVDSAKNITIDSYINNLDRTVYASLYTDIASIFRLFVPLFEDVLKTNLANKSLQVITKAANYIIAPGQKYEGTWHVEGMHHEHIVASGIYYYSTSANIQGSSLAFRELRTDSLEERRESHSLNFYKNLGRAKTPMGRCLVFKNHIQHKVKPIFNQSDTTGTRKILCFFLVDPEHRIKSSSDVPEQQWDRVKPKVKSVISSATRALIKKELPAEVMEHLLSFVKWGFTETEAKEHRLSLMKERKYFVDANNYLWERSFSFCEH